MMNAKMGKMPAKKPVGAGRGRMAGATAENFRSMRNERDMMQEVEDEKMRRRAGKAYDEAMPAMKKGGKVMKYAKGGSIDGCAKRGKTKGKMV